MQLRPRAVGAHGSRSLRAESGRWDNPLANPLRSVAAPFLRSILTGADMRRMLEVVGIVGVTQGGFLTAYSLRDLMGDANPLWVSPNSC